MESVLCAVGADPACTCTSGKQCQTLGIVQVSSDTGDHATADQVRGHLSTQDLSPSSAAGGAGCTASDSIVAKASSDISAARCDSSGLGPSTCESNCNIPSHGLCSNAIRVSRQAEMHLALQQL